MSEPFLSLVQKTLGRIAAARGMGVVRVETTPLFALVLYSGGGRTMSVSEDLREGYISVRVGHADDADEQSPTGLTSTHNERAVSLEMLMVKDGAYKGIPQGFYTLKKPGKRHEALSAFADYIERNADRVFL